MNLINKYLIILACMLLDFNSIAQVYETNPSYNSSNNWVLGDSAGIYFGKDTTYSFQTSLNANEGTAVLSDENGDLLFYTNGIEIYNKNHRKLAIDLKAYFSSTQTSLINRFDSTIYISTTHPVSGFYIGKFQMSGDSLLLIENTKKIQWCTEGQAAINHQNNNSKWLACSKLITDTISFFYLSRNVVLCCPIKRDVDPQSNEFLQMKFSPSGQMFATSDHLAVSSSLYKLNNESAWLSADLDLFQIGNFGIEFSPDENHLLIESIERELVVYDIDSFDIWAIINSKKTLISSPNERLGSLQLNNRGEVLFAPLYTSYLGKIEFEADTVKWTKQGYYLGNGRNSYFGTPNFNASYFYTPSIDFAYTEDCWGHSYAFEGRDTLQATSWKWLFRDIRNNTTEVRQGKNVNYTFPQADSLENKYEVSHIASTATRSDTVTKTLTIRPKWKQDVLGIDTFYCQGKQANITLQAPEDMHCVHWNDEEPNLDDNLGPIVDYDHFHTDTLRVDTAGTYIVKLTNKTFCQAWDTITISEIPNPNKPNIQRKGQELESNTVAAKYTWYLDGKLKFQTQNQTQIPNSNGYWQVQLVSEFGCESELSDSFYVGFASIRDVRLEMLDFRLYPNPSDGKVTIEVPKKGVYKIVVTDLQGKVIYSEKQLLSLSFELEFEFAKGNYIITLRDENGKVGSKQMEVVN